MSDSGRQQGQNASIAVAHEGQRAATPRIMVGTWNGELAVVEARTGRVCWLRRTGRQIGTHALDEEAVYVAPSYSLAMFHRLSRTPQGGEWERLAAQLDAPAQLMALRASDGALMWTYADWKIGGHVRIVTDAGVVVAAGGGQFGSEAATMYAIDAATGARLWMAEGSAASGGIDRIITACGGRVYVHLAGDYGIVTALDIRTGERLWRRQWHSIGPFSPSGTLAIEQRMAYDETSGWTGNLALIAATDGSELAKIPLSGSVRLLTDDGVVYVKAIDDMREPWIAAIDARTGGELWRTSAGIIADYLALDGGMLYYSRLHTPERIVEIGALDAATGERLWQWRTPANLTELLHLWGPRHTPLMLGNSAKRMATVLGSIVSQEHPFAQAVKGRPMRGKKPAPRRQAFRHEFYHGQWRHPWQLHSANNANWLAARWGVVFLGTWLGLFALDARDGRLLWHVLPTLDLSFVAPALAP